MENRLHTHFNNQHTRRLNSLPRRCINHAIDVNQAEDITDRYWFTKCSVCSQH